MKIFKEGLALSKNPVCYNGDLFTVEHYENFTKAYPNVEMVMLGPSSSIRSAIRSAASSPSLEPVYRSRRQNISTSFMIRDLSKAPLIASENSVFLYKILFLSFIFFVSFYKY